MKKNILFVTQSIWAGGTNSALCSLYNNIDKSRYDISVLALDGFGGRRVDYEEVLINRHIISAYYNSGHYSGFLDKMFCIAVKVFKKVAKAFYPGLDEKFNKCVISKLEKEHQYDTVVAYNENVVRFVSYFKCRNKIAWIHCDYDHYLPAGQSEECYYEKYNTIVTVSEHTTEVFRKWYPKLASRCKSIYNLLDIQRIRECSTLPIDDPRYNNDSFTIVSVGRITGVKRFREIPRLAKELKERGCRFRWFIIGPEFDHNEVEAIQGGIIEMNVMNNVFWLGGKSNPYPYFKNADLYVCTSVSEACPMVFIESKVLGTPIVSSDFPSAVEFIHQGEDGFIVPIDKIPETIYDIISNKKIEVLNSNVSKFSFSNEQLLESIYSIL